MVITERIKNLFIIYQQAFKHYDIKDVEACYQIPCTLTTPDEFILVNSKVEFTEQFDKIFNQLQQAKTKACTIKSASYQLISNNLLLVCIDWLFIDIDDKAFTDFTAFYHLIDVNGKLKIAHVTSQPSEQSVALENTLNFDDLEQIKVIK
tara:strand:+ start:134 stop:583 length:450 start_codon:yes stop_codon:yes gene_type:complete